jgi:hypothetical protein
MRRIRRMLRYELQTCFLLAAILAYCCGRVSDVEAEYREPWRDRIRVVLKGMPRSVFDEESDGEQRARLDAAAVAIDQASRTPQDAAALLAIGGAESAFAEYVGAGCHYPDGIPEGASTCDRGKSRSYWQAKRVACRAAWALPRGSDAALRAFAVCARKRFSGALTRCDGQHPSGDRIAGGFAGYRSVDCAWEGRDHDGARARARLYRLRLGQLHQ